MTMAKAGGISSGRRRGGALAVAGLVLTGSGMAGMLVAHADVSAAQALENRSVRQGEDSRDAVNQIPRHRRLRTKSVKPAGW